MNILVINGPNVNMLGVREPEIYGEKTYKDLVEFIEKSAAELDIEVEVFQSNVEGFIIDRIQKAYFEEMDGIIINAGGYTHTSIAIADAIKAVMIPTVEVHLSDITKREGFRKKSFLTPVCTEVIMGRGFSGYRDALRFFVDEL